MSLLIRELDDQRQLSIALHIPLNPGHIEYDRIAGLETTQHSLKIGERSYWRAIDAIDYVAFGQGWSTAGIAKLRYESVRIDFLDVESLNARQVPIHQKLRRKFCERDPEMQSVTARIVILRIRGYWSHPFARA